MIRPANEKDIPAILMLLQQVLLIHHEGRPDIFKERGAKYFREELVQKINDKDNPIFVYEESGNVCGHMFCQSIEHEETGSIHRYKTLYIDDLCIGEKYRNRGIGRSFYTFIKQYARENGYHNITLHAWQCNEGAREFYEHLGMEIQQYTMEEVL